MSPDEARHHDRDRLCIALAEDDLRTARVILARNRNDPSFDISFYGRGDRMLRARAR